MIKDRHKLIIRILLVFGLSVIGIGYMTGCTSALPTNTGAASTTSAITTQDTTAVTEATTEEVTTESEDWNTDNDELIIIETEDYGNSYDDGSGSGNGPEPQEVIDTAKYEDYSFRNNRLLEEHYEKHGEEMGFASAEAYEDAACAVVNNPNALHKLEAEDGDDVYYVEATNEFVVVSRDGYIRTYFYPNHGIDYYNRQ